MSDSDETNKCPGCVGHSKTDQLLAYGMVLSAAEAMFDGRLEDIAYAAKHMTPFEAHKAVTLYCSILTLFCKLTRVDPREYLAAMHEGINEKLAQV